MATLRELSNAQLVNAYFKENPSLGYDGRTNIVTKGTLENTFRTMTEYTPTYNSFVTWLVNRIGRVIFNEKKAFSNPLAEFKDEQLVSGSMVQEIQTGVLTAHSYDPQDDGETVFSREVPDTKVLWHTMNRQEYYKLTINREQLTAAFLNGDGLTNFVDNLMSTPATSDNIDEFNYMVNLFKMYHNELGGFFYMKGGANTLPTDAERARDLVKKIRALGKNMAFPNVHYNAGGMPTWCSADEVVIFTTPETEAMIDVDALAAAFNIDRMTFAQRVITIPSYTWPLPGVNAIVTSKYFFRVFDMLTEFTEIQNPQSLNLNMFLHRWEIISCSAFAPAVALTNDLETITVSAETAAIELGAVAAIDIYPRLGGDDAGAKTVARGDQIALDVTVTVPDGTAPNQTVVWEIRGNASPRTVIDRFGTVTVARDESSDTITVRAYVAGAAPTATPSELALTITGDIVPVIANNDPTEQDTTPAPDPETTP